MSPFQSGPVPVALDVHGRIAADVSCTHCGYNLRGLSHAGRCPECGTAVAASLRGDNLRFCNRDWMKTVIRGTRVMEAAFAVGIILTSLSFPLMAMTSAGQAMGEFLAWLLLLPVVAESIWAAWLFTTPEPGRYGSVGASPSRVGGA